MQFYMFFYLCSKTLKTALTILIYSFFNIKFTIFSFKEIFFAAKLYLQNEGFLLIFLGLVKNYYRLL